jgi:hypothetical protein
MSGVTGMQQRRRSGLDVRQQAWNSIRVLKRFTAAQIEATAEIQEENLRKYLKALAAAGYLAQVRPKQNGRPGGHAIWRLARDSGPRAPLVRYDGSGVYDPNQDQLYPGRNEVANDRATRRGGLVHGV